MSVVARLKNLPIGIAKNLRRPALPILLVFAMTSAVAVAGDLSKYRDFQFGADLAAIAQQVGATPSQAKALYLRPALIQELQWRPHALVSSSQTESAQEVDFSFYDGKLFRIAIDYDRYQVEGLTADDFIEAISAAYGTAERPAPSADPQQGRYSDEEVIVARWQDSLYRFVLVRSSFRPSFKLIGVSKGLEAPAQAAILEAKRLDNLEAPQREAARLAGEDEVAKAALAKARLVNKPKFRP